MKFFVATSPEHIPADVKNFFAVDGQVAGAKATWDHHVSGECINLDAMPASIDLSGIEAVGTHMMDADAIVSAAVVALGGESRVPEQYRPVLRSCAHWCDHLYAHPNFNEETNRAGLGLLFSQKNRGFATLNKVAKDNHGGDSKLVTMAEKSAVFAGFVEELVEIINAGRELPFDLSYLEKVDRMAEMLSADRNFWSDGFIAFLDLRGKGYVDPIACYRVHGCVTQLTVGDHRSGNGAVTYTVGVHPAGPKPDLRPLIAKMVEAEAQAWQMANETQPDGTWGGREAVFGSPFNYGSRLSPEQVTDIVRTFVVKAIAPPFPTCECGQPAGGPMAVHYAGCEYAER